MLEYKQAEFSQHQKRNATTSIWAISLQERLQFHNPQPQARGLFRSRTPESYLNRFPLPCISVYSVMFCFFSLQCRLQQGSQASGLVYFVCSNLRQIIGQRKADKEYIRATFCMCFPIVFYRIYSHKCNQNEALTCPSFLLDGLGCCCVCRVPTCNLTVHRQFWMP